MGGVVVLGDCFGNPNLNPKNWVNLTRNCNPRYHRTHRDDEGSGSARLIGPSPSDDDDLEYKLR